MLVIHWKKYFVQARKWPEAEGRATFLRPRQNIFQYGRPKQKITFFQRDAQSNSQKIPGLPNGFEIS